MPILVLDYNGVQRTVPFARRLTMGRASSCDMVVDHPAISRTHAIFEQIDGKYVVTDMGSKNGLYLDDVRVSGRHRLMEADRLQIGPAVVSFYTSEAPPERALPAPAKQLPARRDDLSIATQSKDGVIIHCTCGTRLWIPREMVGGRGQCPKCRKTVDLVDPDAPLKSVCSICQWEIAADQAQHICPNCGLVFHDECWQENRGCSAYGCSQVGVLDRRDDDATVDLPAPFGREEEIGHPPMHPRGSGAFPWEFAFLGGSILFALLGLLLFGTLSIVAGVAAVIYYLRHRDSIHKIAMFSAIAICVVGLFAGLIASQVWWMGRTLESFIGR